MFSFFSKKKQPVLQPFTTDMHSHLLPGIDDGAETLEKSLKLINELRSFGYKKLITTPHIMGDAYRNTPEIIQQKLTEVQTALKTQGSPIQLAAAAEYYLDEWFVEKLEKEEKLLTFGKNYLLFEMSYLNPSPQLNSAIFSLRTQGYQPVLAHPERYMFYYENFERLQRLAESNVLFQLNLTSLTGYYGKAAQIQAEKLIKNKLVHFVGTDCHAMKHVDALEDVFQTKYLKKIAEQPLLNQLV
jgi:tyrosine-protein phosphatase YwqE